MKITLFTSNNIRHNYLINLISSVSEELFVVQETRTIFPGSLTGIYKISPFIERYFKDVDSAQKKLFGYNYINNLNKNIKILTLSYGDLNHFPIKLFSNFLDSDVFIIYGSSYIKGDLIDFLISKKAINIHAGLSPYYRGTDCNFWALFDENPHLVGATIHLLSRGLDSGPILYHAMSNIRTNPYEYTMSTVKSAFHSIAEKIKDETISKIEPIDQNKNQEVRYSLKKEFTEEVVKDYFAKNINLKFNFDNSLLKDPYFLNN